MIKTAVIGASGYVGRRLLAAYREGFPDAVGTSFSAKTPGLIPFDIRRPDVAALRLEEAAHEAVLISSAKPNIAFCEKNRDDAYAVNVTGTLELARRLGRTRLKVIFLSSDYVFDGRTGGYDDGAPTSPSTEYGRQKALVEKELPSLVKDPLILRLSKIYGVQKGDGTLLDEMAASFAAKKPARAARDQAFCPTNADDLARLALAAQDAGASGVVNLCNPRRWTRYDIAAALAKAMGAAPALVEPISLHDIPALAGRPLDTSMKCSRLSALVPCLRFAPLEDDIRRVAAAWGAPS